MHAEPLGLRGAQVGNLWYKAFAVETAMEKHVDIYGIMILKSIYDKYCCFYEAVLILLNIKASEFHKGRQCHEWRLSVRQRTECS